MADKMKNGHRETRKLIRRIAKHDPVPCDGCTACCRNHQAVSYMDGDDVSLFTAYGKVGQNWQPILPQKGNGDCGYLGEDGCSIYDHRPLVCRAFDCRRQAATFTAEQQIEALMTNVYSLAVFVAGRERLHTVKPLPEEEALWEGKGFAEYLLARGGDDHRGNRGPLASRQRSPR